MKYIYVFIGFLLTIQIASASENYSIEGQILETQQDGSKNIIYGATVFVKGTDFGALTDSNGYFYINVLRPGIYLLQISDISHFSKMITVTVSDTNSTSLKIDLEKKAVEKTHVICPDELLHHPGGVGMIKGYIYDNSLKNALAGAVITYKIGENLVGTISKEDGSYLLKMASGTYNLQIQYWRSDMKFITGENFEVTIKKNSTNIKNFYLECDSEPSK